MGRVERRPADRGDDVTGLETGLIGWTARRRRTPAPAAPHRTDPGPWPWFSAAMAADGRGPTPLLATGRLLACWVVGSIVWNIDAEPRSRQGLAGRCLRQQRAGDIDRDREPDALALAGARGIDEQYVAALQRRLKSRRCPRSHHRTGSAGARRNLRNNDHGLIIRPH